MKVVEEWQAQRDPKRGAEILEGNRGLVGMVLRREVRVPAELWEDAWQEGLLALWEAMGSWDPKGGRGFVSYAVQCVKWKILTWLKGQIPIAASEQAVRAWWGLRVLRGELGRDPTDAELEERGIEVGVARRMEKAQRPDPGAVVGRLGEAPEGAESVVRVREIEEAIEALGPAEERAIVEVCIKGKLLREVAAEAGVTQQAISAAKLSGLKKLKGMLAHAV